MKLLTSRRDTQRDNPCLRKKHSLCSFWTVIGLESNYLLEPYTAKKEAILATYETVKPYFEEIYSKKHIKSDMCCGGK